MDHILSRPITNDACKLGVDNSPCDLLQSTENLLQDIERYRQEYRNTEHVFSALKKKLESLETCYNSSCLNMVDMEEILKINTVLCDIK